MRHHFGSPQQSYLPGSARSPAHRCAAHMPSGSSSPTERALGTRPALFALVADGTTAGVPLSEMLGLAHTLGR
jgi:hypothetical protein